MREKVFKVNRENDYSRNISGTTGYSFRKHLSWTQILIEDLVISIKKKETFPVLIELTGEKTEIISKNHTDRSQTERQKSYDITYMWTIKKN